MEAEIRSKLIDFVVSNYLFGDKTRVPDSSQSLLEAGIIDSTGILELVDFLENDLGVEVLDTETTPENLDSIDSLTAFYMRKKSA